MRDGWVATPRASSVTPGRPRSTRELYHPAVQDFSEQADRNGGNNYEESILSVVSSCTPRGSRPGSDYYTGDKYHCPTPLISHLSPEEMIKSSPTASYCFNQHNTEYNEDIHRQRVLVSAHHRQKLHSRLRRVKSTPRSAQRGYGTLDTQDGDRGTRWQTADIDQDRISLIVTNRSIVDEKDCKERINYRLTSRTKPKSSQSQGSSLMPNGAPLSMMNGYTQTLLQNYPRYSQKYTSWLTNGFKVQSVRSRPGSRDYDQYRQPPPLLQYIHRPKTVNEHYKGRNTNVGVNFNVVGVQNRS